MSKFIIKDGVRLKRCSDCGQLLSLESFYSNKRKIEGLHNVCKKCNNERSKKYQQKKREEIFLVNPGKTKKCKECGKDQPLSSFSPHIKSKDGLQYICKQCRAERQRKYNADFRKERKAELEKKNQRKPRPLKITFRAPGEERCSNCKSFSNCGHGSGYCMKHKISTRIIMVCSSHIPNIERTFEKEARQINIFKNTPYL